MYENKWSQDEHFYSIWKMDRWLYIVYTTRKEDMGNLMHTTHIEGKRNSQRQRITYLLSMCEKMTKTDAGDLTNWGAPIWPRKDRKLFRSMIPAYERLRDKGEQRSKQNNMPIVLNDLTGINYIRKWALEMMLRHFLHDILHEKKSVL